MKPRDYKISVIKHRVLQARSRKNGKNYILEELKQEERMVLEGMFNVRPYLYRVRLYFPMGFRPTKDTSRILRELYWYKRKTKHYFKYVHLSDNQVETCKQAGLEVRVFKYKIS